MTGVASLGDLGQQAGTGVEARSGQRGGTRVSWPAQTRWPLWGRLGFSSWVAEQRATRGQPGQPHPSELRGCGRGGRGGGGGHGHRRQQRHQGGRWRNSHDSASSNRARRWMARLFELVEGCAGALPARARLAAPSPRVGTRRNPDHGPGVEFHPCTLVLSLRRVCRGVGRRLKVAPEMVAPQPSTSRRRTTLNWNANSR